MKLFGYDIPGGDTVKDILNVGSKLLGTYNDDRSSGNIGDILARRENAEWQYNQDWNKAAQAYNEKASAAAAAGRAASARNASARAAAAAQTEANRQKALKKAQHFLQGKYKETMAMYEPFKQSATDLLPQMQQNYTSGMNLSNSLMGLLQQPENMAMLKQTPTASMLGPRLPDFLKGGK